MLYTVYRVVNKINQKEYIGFHRITDNGIIQEKSDSGSIFLDGYLGSGKLIKKAILKYGTENMSQELLFVSDNKEEAELVEAQFANEEYVQRPDTYNIAKGGNVRAFPGINNPFYGQKHKQETIDRIQTSRRKTHAEKPYSSAQLFDVESGRKFLNAREAAEYYGITDTFLGIHSMIYEGKLKYSTSFLQERSLDIYRKRKQWIDGKEARKMAKSEAVSKRFKGSKQSDEHRKKRGEGQSAWIKANPEEHKIRMDKINKNPEKIRKMAEKHRGMKRSLEARKRMSEAQKGRRVYHNPITSEITYIRLGNEIPDGFLPGYGGLRKNGRNKRLSR